MMTEQAFHIEGAALGSRWLLTCDHATNRVPDWVGGGDLGIAADDMARHIAYDVGAAGLTRGRAARLDAPAILSDFSRLVIDPNRGEDDPTLLMRIYDGTVIPANRHADAAERERRLVGGHAEQVVAVVAADVGDHPARQFRQAADPQGARVSGEVCERGDSVLLRAAGGAVVGILVLRLGGGEGCQPLGQRALEGGGHLHQRGRRSVEFGSHGGDPGIGDAARHDVVEAAELAALQLTDVRTKMADLTRIEAVLSRLVNECHAQRGTVSCPLIDSLHGS